MGVIFATSSLGAIVASVGGVLFAFSFFISFYTGIPLLVFGIFKLKEKYYDNNDKNVEKYFKEIINELENSEKDFIEKIKMKKDEFIERLNKTNKITPDEIKDLIKANYPSNFQKIIVELE